MKIRVLAVFARLRQRRTEAACRVLGVNQPVFAEASSFTALLPLAWRRDGRPPGGSACRSGGV